MSDEVSLGHRVQPGRITDNDYGLVSDGVEQTLGARLAPTAEVHGGGLPGRDRRRGSTAEASSAEDFVLSARSVAQLPVLPPRGRHA